MYGADYDIVKERFDILLAKKKNVIFERAKFFKRIQTGDEPVEVFINDLYRLAENCDFKNIKDEMIRDRIVVGVRDQNLSECLQRNPNLTLEIAIARPKQFDTVKKQQSTVRSEIAVEEINKKFINRR